jgi:hypothetical protein
MVLLLGRMIWGHVHSVIDCFGKREFDFVFLSGVSCNIARTMSTVRFGGRVIA